MASEESPETTISTETTEATDASATAAEVAAPPKRRRATKKAAAPEVPAENSTQSPAEASEPAAPKATRKRVSKKATTSTSHSRKATEPAPEAQQVEEVEEVEPSVEDEILEAEATEATEAGTAEDEAADTAAATVPSFGLLFQAPDTTVVRRSRRATAPVQAPVVTEDDAPRADVASADEAQGSSARDASEGGASADTDAPAAAGADESEDLESAGRRRRRGGRGRRGRSGAEESETPATDNAGSNDQAGDAESTSEEDNGSEPVDGEEAGRSETSRRRRRRRRSGGAAEGDDPPGTVTRVRQPRASRDEPTAVKGSTRLEAKKQRRREGREAGRRRTIITEAEFLARRESVDRVMVVRGTGERTQIGVLEDGVLVEHYVSRETSTTMVGNVYLGRVQNVLPSMEAAFVDIGKGRNAVLYAGEVNWDAAGLEVNQAKRIENALTSGDTVLVQVTKDPIGHKGARLTSQISLPGRFLVYVPEGSMTGISRKLPDTERARLKSILKEIVPDSAGVIVRTAAEGASEEELRADVERLTKAWEKIQKKARTAGSKKAGSGGAPVLVHGEPDLTVRVIRDIFTEDFSQLVVSGEKAWADVSEYVEDVAPDLAQRLTRWTSEEDLFTHHRVQEQIAKAMDRKVWLPSGGSLVIDRTEAMTVVDVNTGKFIGSGGNLEETVTKNNIEAAEEIVRQLRLRDIGGIIVIDFIDMVLESNRDLVVRRLLECLGRDRTKHQVAEVTSLGLVQMTRKRVGSGLIEVFSETCEHCSGRGIIVHSEPIDRPSNGGSQPPAAPGAGSGSRTRGRRGSSTSEAPEPERKQSGPTAAQIAAAAHAAALISSSSLVEDAGEGAEPVDQEQPLDVVRELEGDEPVMAAEAQEPEFHQEVAGAAEAVAAAPEVEAPVMAAEPEEGPEFTAEEPPEVAPPAARGRRRRGRVVAPAGPPRSTTDES